MLFLLLGARARPLRAVAVIGDAGDCVAAVDVEDRSGDVTRNFGSKKHAGFNHVLGGFGSSQRQPADALDYARAVGLARRVAARYRIDIDAVKSQRVRRRAGEAVDGAAIGGP